MVTEAQKISQEVHDNLSTVMERYAVDKIREGINPAIVLGAIVNGTIKSMYCPIATLARIDSSCHKELIELLKGFSDDIAEFITK